MRKLSIALTLSKIYVFAIQTAGRLEPITRDSCMERLQFFDLRPSHRQFGPVRNANATHTHDKAHSNVSKEMH